MLCEKIYKLYRTSLQFQYLFNADVMILDVNIGVSGSFLSFLYE